MGAVATWYGVPVRIAKLSNFIIGYTVQKIGVSSGIQDLAQTIGTPNGVTAQVSWKAGTDLASGVITLADLPGIVKRLFIEADDEGKTQNLWPNPNLVDNFEPSDLIADYNRQFTHPGFLEEIP